MFLVFFAYQRFLASCILVSYFPKLLVGSLLELQHHLVFYHESQPACVERCHLLQQMRFPEWQAAFFLLPICFCRDEFLSWLYSTKSLYLKCREQRPELVIG